MVALKDDPLSLGRCALQGCQNIRNESVQVAPQSAFLAQSGLALAVPGYRLAVKVIAQQDNTLGLRLLDELQRSPERSHVSFGIVHIGKDDRAGDLHSPIVPRTRAGSTSALAHTSMKSGDPKYPRSTRVQANFGLGEGWR